MNDDVLILVTFGKDENWNRYKYVSTVWFGKKAVWGLQVQIVVYYILPIIILFPC